MINVDFAGLHLSPRMVELLQGSTAEQYRRTCWTHCTGVFEFVLDQYPAYKDLFRLDPHVAMTALDSAFIDLHRDEEFHEHKKGPAPEKLGAAAAAWLNRFRPIQVLATLDTTDHVAMYINPIWSLLVGWSVCALNKAPDNTAASADMLSNLSPEHGKQLLELIYNLQWRNPGYRHLTLAFSLATFI